MLDGPFTILCIVMVPGESHCPHGPLGLQPPVKGGREGLVVGMGPTGHQAVPNTRATPEGNEHRGTCHGAWAKYPKKQWDEAAGHIWVHF